MSPTLKEFKAGIKRHADNLRKHGLMDPAESTIVPRKYKTNKEKESKADIDLLDEFTAPPSA